MLLFIILLISTTHCQVFIGDLPTIIEEFKQCYIVLRYDKFHANTVDFILPKNIPLQVSTKILKGEEVHKNLTSLDDMFKKLFEIGLRYVRRRNYCSAEFIFGGLIANGKLIEIRHHRHYSVEWPQFIIAIVYQDYSLPPFSHKINLGSLTDYIIWTLVRNHNETNGTHSIQLICHQCRKNSYYIVTIDDCLVEKNCKKTLETSMKYLTKEFIYVFNPIQCGLCKGSIGRILSLDPYTIDFEDITICLIGENTTMLPSKEFYFDQDYARYFPTITFGPQNSNDHKISRTTLITQIDKYNFITCDGNFIPSMSYTIYFKPFDTYVWIGILVTVFLSSLVLTLRAYVFPSSRQKYKQNFISHICVQMSLLASSLIEHGTYEERMLNGNEVVKNIFAIWLVLSIVLTNGYRGVVVSLLAVPLRPGSKWETFEQIVRQENFTIFSTIKRSMETYNLQFNVCSKPQHTQYCSDLATEFLFNRTDMLEAIKFNRSRHWADDLVKLRLFYQGNLSVFYDNLSSCNRTAFGDLDSKLKKYMSYFEERSRNSGDMSIVDTYYKGKGNFGSQRFGWTIGKNPTSVFYDRLNSVFNTGIYKYWSYWFSENGKFNTRVMSTGSVPTQGMNTNIGSVFLILIFGCIIAIILFSIESILAVPLSFQIKNGETAVTYLIH